MTGNTVVEAQCGTSGLKFLKTLDEYTGYDFYLYPISSSVLWWKQSVCWSIFNFSF